MLPEQSLIFGKNTLKNIVSCEVKDDEIELFFEENGSIFTEVKANVFWLLSPNPLDKHFKMLSGNLYYKFIKTYSDKRSFYADKRKFKNNDVYSIADEKEAAMVYNGFTYFKGMKVEDVSILSFDIETNGLLHNEDSKVVLISNTFRYKGGVIRKLFAYDEYSTEAGMFDAWSEWVREVNPSVLVGHNVFVFDIPYLDFVARKAGTVLELGRDGSAIKFNSYDSKFRKDGSQFYEYKKAFVYGREIVDTMFLSYRYDFSRKYENYRLKSIIKAEGLEVANRQFYDGDKIRYNYTDPVEWAKIKQYAIHDADDALALYDLMIPAYFYLTPSIPKSFQSMMISASGSQINSFLVRSYLQDKHSIPKTTEANHFEGAISLGNPGSFKNVFKVDVASLYPSIMLEYKIHDRYKDPKQHFLKMVEYFTNERLVNKKKAKETGDRYYKDLEQAQKIIINSSYGLLGATGLGFNSPNNASLVTRKGREILQTAIDWSAENKFQLVNADTDSISISYSSEPLSKEDREEVLRCINSLFPKQISWEDDGYYPRVLVLKAKNYVLLDEKGKTKIKGSALKASMKEKALKEFINKTLSYLLEEKNDQLPELYNSYVKEIYTLTDITRWSSKKTITASVLNPERTNEQKVLDALDGEEFQEGDKIFVYFDKGDQLKLQDKWSNDHNAERLVGKLHDTLCIFDTVIDTSTFPKYHHKNHKVKCELHDLLGLPHPEKVKRPRKPKVDKVPENEVQSTHDKVC